MSAGFAPGLIPPAPELPGGMDEVEAPSPKSHHCPLTHFGFVGLVAFAFPADGAFGRWEATTGGGPEHLADQDHASPQLWQDLWEKLFQA